MTLHITLLGQFRLFENQQLVDTLNSPRLQLFIAYLVLNRHAAISREMAAAALWPDSTDQQARNNLRRLIYRLRQQLPVIDAYLKLSPTHLEWRHDQPLSLDLDQFESALNNAYDVDSWRSAVELYSGELMPSQHAEWLVAERVLWHQRWLNGWEQYATMAADGRHFDQAIIAVNHLLAHDPLREEYYRWLMLLYMQVGDRAAALAIYEQAVQQLMNELGVPPSAPTRELHLQIVQADNEMPLAGRFLTTGASTQSVANYPTYQTDFIGRQDELSKLEELLQRPDNRLLTVIGAGGMGKTRLSVELASRLRGRYADGVYFVPLAAVHDPAQLVNTIVTTVGLTVGKQSSVDEQLIHYLSDRNLLLILDNFEHLIAARTWVKKFLAVPGKAQLLILSRERLNLLGEWVFELHGLPLPDVDGHHSNDISDGVQLFLNTAERVKPDLTTTTADLETIATICRQTAGMPLALELAAGWAGTLSLVEIGQRLNHSHALLQTTANNVPERHQSIAATFDYSWELLSVEARHVASRLAVFIGPFSSQAAEEILQTDLMNLRQLADQSLLRRQADGMFDIHPLLHQYLRKQLNKLEPSDLNRLHVAHAAYYLTMVASKERPLFTAYQRGEIAQDVRLVMLSEIDNIRAAWHWAIDHVGHFPQLTNDLLIDFVNAFGRFLNQQSWYQDALELFETGLEIVECDRTQRAQWLRKAGHAWFSLSQHEQARQSLRQALTTLGFKAPQTGSAVRGRTLGQLLRQAWTRLGPSRSASGRANNDSEKNRANQEISIACDLIARIYFFDSQQEMSVFYALAALNVAELGDLSSTAVRGYANLCVGMTNNGRHRWGAYYHELALQGSAQLAHAPTTAYVSRILGIYHSMIGNWARAQSLFQEAITIYDRLGDREQWGECFASYNIHFFAQGKYTEAAKLWTELSTVARRSGSAIQLAWGNAGQGSCLLQLGRAQSALPYLQEGLVLMDEIDFLQGKMNMRGIFGTAYVRLGQYIEAYQMAKQVMALSLIGEPTFITAISAYGSVCEVCDTLLGLPDNEFAQIGVHRSEVLNLLETASKALLGRARGATIGLPRALLYQGLSRWHSGQAAAAHKLWAQAIKPAEAINTPYEQGLIKAAQGRYHPDGVNSPAARHLLEEACAKFQMVQTAYELEMVRELLNA